MKKAMINQQKYTWKLYKQKINKTVSIGLMSKVFAIGPGDQGSIPSWVIPKT